MIKIEIPIVANKFLWGMSHYVDEDIFLTRCKVAGFSIHTKENFEFVVKEIYPTCLYVLFKLVLKGMKTENIKKYISVSSPNKHMEQQIKYAFSYKVEELEKKRLRAKKGKIANTVVGPDISYASAPFAMCIPDIGTVLKLEEDWNFRLYYEYRNKSLFEVFSPNVPGFTYDSRKNFKNITLPKGCILRVDRVYIRQGASDFSSISFTVKFWPDKTSLKAVRFWAKLSDVNSMKVIVDTTTLSKN